MTSSIRSTTAIELRSVDRDLLVAMRGSETVGVGELIESLGVTATAVRQRIDRLLEMGLIEREKVVAGRGRPTYRYRLTISGHRSAGANTTEFADAMWREILDSEDTDVRDQLLSAIAARMGRQYAAQMNVDTDESFHDRMQHLSEMLAVRQIDTGISQAGQLPVLDITSCPYPTLTDASDDRSMCRLEEQMFSEALGQPVQLSSCRLDGDSCCQFSPVETNTEST